MTKRLIHFGLAIGLAASACLAVAWGGAGTGRQKSPLHSLTSLNGQLYGAAPGEVRRLDSKGGQTSFAKVPFKIMSLAPFGSKLLVADLAGKTISTLDPNTGRSRTRLRPATRG